MKAVINISTLPSNDLLVLNEGNITRLFFSFTKPKVVDTLSPPNPNNYECENVDVPNPADYGSIINAIVTDKYPSDKKDAIVANYELVRDNVITLSADKKQQYSTEYNQFQAYRVFAKEIANKVLAE